MFKFNFHREVELVESETCTPKENHLYESKEIEIPSDIEDIVNKIAKSQVINIDYDCGISFSCLSAKQVLDTLKNKSDGDAEFLDALKADKQHSDLLPQIYEGGLKIWECTKDLVVYFMKQIVGETNEKLSGKTVLDLGCGSGILGIMCLLQGAFVTFQDYNKEVLEAMTIPNIFLNCKSLEDRSLKDRRKIKLYSGDWSSFLDLILEKIRKEDSESMKFDYILTSETIYNPGNYKKIIRIISKLLKSGGAVFVAAKVHYFGVGGNLKEFETLLHEEGLFSSLCWETKDGVSRRILKVTLKEG